LVGALFIRDQGASVVDETERIIERLSRCAGWQGLTASAALQKRDAAQFVYCCGDSETRLGIVLDAMGDLASLGMLEQSLVVACTSARTNNSHLAPRYLEAIFNELCDRSKLLAAGDPLPGAGPFRVFRGVAGQRGQRFVRGLSWTSDLDLACWFACRFDLETPAVYSAEVQASEVFFYTERRNESEFVVRPRRTSRLRVSPTEIKERADLSHERKRQTEAPFLAAVRNFIHNGY